VNQERSLFAAILRILVPIVCTTTLGACAETELLLHTAKRISTSNIGNADGARYKVGNPYQIQGVWYYPNVEYEYDETGIASWYGPGFHGKNTANGESYDMNELTAAHRTLPLPSFVRVTNLQNGRSLVLRVNDRGPFAHGRILDASRRAAQLLGFKNKGTARVRVQILADESRAIAARLQGKATLASIGSPITADAMPKAAVSHESIAPPLGGKSSAPKVYAPQTIATKLTIERSDVETPTTGIVSITPIRPTNVYVQAGAYANYNNANRVRATLSVLGEVKLTSLLISGKDLFRVRVGPIEAVVNADQILERVIRSGYPDARIIVD
jgi:rare lipoprotein A